VILGSYVPDGTRIGHWLAEVTRGLFVFYDIDTPVTLANLAAGEHAYVSPELLPRFDLYLSFTGGPALKQLEQDWGAQRARALYCAVDARAYGPQAARKRWTLGYLGTFSPDRQEKLQRLLLQTAEASPERAFVVAGAQYPAELAWPGNVERYEHVAPPDHAAFYCAQEFTLNLTRADMVAAGHAPSVRLFEAAACGVPVISDAWPGIEHFFRPGREILLAESAGDVLDIITGLPRSEADAIAAAARAQVLKAHTADHRAAELEGYLTEAAGASWPRLAASRATNGPKAMGQPRPGFSGSSTGPVAPSLHGLSARTKVAARSDFGT
jgi:spore maturation protein CgeB